MKLAALKRYLPLLLIILVMVLMMQSSVLACPTCKDTLAQNDPAGENLARGYFWSIIFMMSMPFLILSSLSAYFYYEVLKARKAKAAAEQAAAVAELAVVKLAVAKESQSFPDSNKVDASIMASADTESACEELVEV